MTGYSSHFVSYVLSNAGTWEGRWGPEFPLCLEVFLRTSPKGTPLVEVPSPGSYSVPQSATIDGYALTSPPPSNKYYIADIAGSYSPYASRPIVPSATKNLLTFTPFTRTNINTCILVYDDSRFLRSALTYVWGVSDKVYVLIEELPWNGESRDLSGTFSIVNEFVREMTGYDKGDGKVRGSKVTVVSEDWGSETEQRQYCNELVKMKPGAKGGER